MIEIIQDKIYQWSRGYGKKVGLDLPYFVKNGFWMTIRQAVTLLSGLMVSIIFSRMASPETYGNYQFFVSLFSTIAVISIPGLNNSLLQSVARGNDGDYKKVVKKSFWWSLLGVPIIVGLGIYFLEKNVVLGQALLISALFFPFFYSPNSWNAFLQGKREYKIVTIFSVIQIIVNAALTIGAILINSENLLFIVLIYLFSYTFFNIVFYFYSLRWIDNTKEDPDCIKYGFFINKINFFEMIAENFDRVMIGFFLSPAQLAGFAIVSMIPIKLKAMLKSILVIMVPKFSEENNNLYAFLKARKKFLTIIFFVGLITVIIFALIAAKINSLLFGENYTNYYAYSAYFAPFLLFSLPAILLGWYAQSKKNKKALIFANPVYYTIKIILTVYLVNAAGVFGAIIALNINAIIQFAIYLFFIIKSDKKAFIELRAS